ncbi:MAG: hypothetical protein LBC71_06245 [Oscillospiraceae bacterium]|jgi:hypothetical protein|nr:hypothetical protein [Oscillospiraceae bacterium]
MRIKGTLLVTSIILLVILSGCKSVNLLDQENNNLDTDTLAHRRIQWVEINTNENTSFNEQVFKLIETSKSMDEDYENYYLLSQHEVVLISKFYNLDKLKIEGHELEAVYVNSDFFIYKYTSSYDKEKESIPNNIVISITRNDWIDRNLPDTDLIEDQLTNYVPGVVTLTTDDILYFKNSAMILALLGDTEVTVQAQGINMSVSYEYLRDLTFKIIETAELVEVK